MQCMGGKYAPFKGMPSSLQCLVKLDHPMNKASISLGSLETE